MPSTAPSRPRRLLGHCSWLLAGAQLVAGCASVTPATPSPIPALSDAGQVTPAPESAAPAVRYGRYALIEVGVTASQHDLMQQIIDVTMPGADNATVGDALRYVLRRSGYRLCGGNDSVPSLFDWPLPAADLHLGPVTLHEALQALAGDAWQLAVDNATRTVCFSPVSGTSPLPALPVTTPDPAASGDSVKSAQGSTP
ncbi:PilL N-terminal domain-containing protein [Burkholderia cepacia]|uniref:PFGI-1 class ICE element type IV pilus protein PilL2 n=1 Tax=Burkholderia cepacia TaxID=292 RepID=UPI00158C87DE|nr:PilL N-terminal domain-containing protein [Burkholderia cepacia]